MTEPNPLFLDQRARCPKCETVLDKPERPCPFGCEVSRDA